MAPMTSVPSRPRFMRPLRSVMHSPRLTNRNGVLTRTAPPSTASGTPHNPMEGSAMVQAPLRRGKAGGAARQETDDDNEASDRQADDLAGPYVAAGDPRREAEHRVIDQNIGEQGGQHPEGKAPVHVGEIGR